MGMLDGKTAIVTGAARGIGFAIARRYIADDARVVIADIDESAGKAAAAALGPAARFVRTDVGAAGDARNVVSEACGVDGTLDILVNNAGIIHTADFLDVAEADFDRVLRVNLKGMFLIGQVAAKQMVAQVKAGKPAGAIVNMSSVNARVAIPNQVPYCVSKGGVDQLTKVMALSLRALWHPRQRDRPGLDHDRHPEGRRNRQGGAAAPLVAHPARAHRRPGRDRLGRGVPGCEGFRAT